MFNVGQFPASILSPISTQICTGHLHLNYVLYSEPSFPAPQLYLLRHTLKAHFGSALKWPLTLLFLSPCAVERAGVAFSLKKNQCL